MNTKSRLSQAVIALIISGASGGAILSGFLNEKEGGRLRHIVTGAAWSLFVVV